MPPINQFSGPDELKQGRCALAQPWLWVDHTGRRFFNESRGSVFVDVYNAMTSAGGVLYTIFDQQKMDQMVQKGAVLPFNAIVLAGVPLKALPKTWEIGMERGWAFKADTAIRSCRTVARQVRSQLCIEEQRQVIAAFATGPFDVASLLSACFLSQIQTFGAAPVNRLVYTESGAFDDSEQ